MTNFIFQNQQEGEKTTEMNNRWGGAFAQRANTSNPGSRAAMQSSKITGPNVKSKRGSTPGENAVRNRSSIPTSKVSNDHLLQPILSARQREITIEPVNY